MHGRASQLASCVITYILALGVAFIMLRIEWLNVEAGSKLPSREYRDGDPAEGCVTWRSSILIDEEMWRRSRGPRDADYQPLSRPLTPAEQIRMRSDIRQAQANNALRDFVGTAGLLQYLLVPLLVIASAWVFRAKGARYALLPLGIAIAAGVLMFYRAYFSSLG